MSPVTATVPAANFLDALSAAREGIDSGLKSFDAVAQSVASNGDRGLVAAADMVGALEAKNQVALSARLYQSADQMLGTILDLRA